jgi:hypothetical protein
MHQFFSACRLCVNMIGICFKDGINHAMGPHRRRLEAGPTISAGRVPRMLPPLCRKAPDMHRKVLTSPPDRASRATKLEPQVGRECALKTDDMHAVPQGAAQAHGVERGRPGFLCIS